MRRVFCASRPEQWWPLVEAVLRTGCTKTICHPFQVNIGKHTDLTWVTDIAFTGVNTVI
jgi:hypothetical protein